MDSSGSSNSSSNSSSSTDTITNTPTDIGDAPRQPQFVVAKIIQNADEVYFHTRAYAVCPEFVVRPYAYGVMSEEITHWWFSQWKDVYPNYLRLDTSHRCGVFLMQYYPYKSLWTFLHRHILDLSSADWRSLFSQFLVLLTRLQLVEGPGYRHRDSHFSNFIVDNDGEQQETPPDITLTTTTPTILEEKTPKNMPRVVSTQVICDKDGISCVIQCNGFFRGSCWIRAMDFQFTKIEETKNNEYFDMHMFFNCLIQHEHELRNSHVTGTTKRRELPMDVKLFLLDMVPPTLRYKDQKQETSHGSESIHHFSTGKLRSKDPQIWSPIAALTQHPFFEPVRMILRGNP